MDLPELKIRRARRLDFAAVMRLLAPAGEPSPDRRTLRRFRSIVADLGADLYVAEVGGEIVGVVHASYVRQLGGGQRGRIEDLAASPERAGLGVEKSLLEFIVARARKRDCSALSCVPASSGAGAVAANAGLEPHQQEYRRNLSRAAGGDSRPAS
jgi:N-acetylglutamate synthase-like GNAT family acetyltransferase